MKFLVVFLFIMPITFGWVEWKSVIVGDVGLPSTVKEARADGWTEAAKTSSLKIRWFMKDDDPALLVAFDKRNNLAGARINQLQSQVRANYSGLYESSELFQETTLNHKKYFSVTLLFTSPSVLKSGGRQKLATDEEASGLFVQRGDLYEQIHRDGCDHDDTGAVEQGCQDQYGLVFSDWDRTSSCDSLSPFYTMWDPSGTGNLIGCGLLTFTDKTQSQSRAVDKNSFKSLFPRSPSCLDTAAKKGVRTVEVWFTREVSLETTCPSGDWSSSHCDRRNTRYTAL